MISKINENLYLSDWGACRLEYIQELGITKIISLGNEKEHGFYKIHENVEYLKIIIEDDKDENISQYFDKTNKFISEGIVLVHCNKGISRSSAIIISYLMNKEMSYVKAFQKVKKCRYLIKPNIGFINQRKSVV